MQHSRPAPHWIVISLRCGGCVRGRSPRPRVMWLGMGALSGNSSRRVGVLRSAARQDGLCQSPSGSRPSLVPAQLGSGLARSSPFPAPDGGSDERTRSLDDHGHAAAGRRPLVPNEKCGASAAFARWSALPQGSCLRTWPLLGGMCSSQTQGAGFADGRPCDRMLQEAAPAAEGCGGRP